MKTLLQAILDRSEVALEDSKLTVKECVLAEDDDAKCLKTPTGYSVLSFCSDVGFESPFFRTD